MSEGGFKEQMAAAGMDPRLLAPRPEETRAAKSTATAARLAALRGRFPSHGAKWRAEHHLDGPPPCWPGGREGAE
jgi:hypothetical protein